MMPIRRSSKRRRGLNRRRGLAPLEFAIVAPLFLFMMALMVNFATTGIWRIRAEVSARDQAFRVRWPRTGRNEPWQPFWNGNTDAAVDTRQVPQMDVLDVDATNHPVVRGPIPNGFVVNNTLDPKQGMINGWASMNGRYPMLRSLGSFRVGPAESPILDRTFQNAMMRIPREFRRSLVIWELPQTDQSLVDAYMNAIQVVSRIEQTGNLAVMDRHQDVRIALRHYVDFYPYLRHPYQGAWIVNSRYCERDPERVYDQWILGPSPNLIDRVDPLAPRPQDRVRFGRISNLPRRLCGFYLGMYERVKREIESILERLGQPDVTPEERARLTARLNELRQIQDLDGKIAQLRRYQERLTRLEESLRERSLADYERYVANAGQNGP